MDEPDVQTIVQQAIDEYMRQDSARREPAYKTELQEERRRREQLEKRMNETGARRTSAAARWRRRPSGRQQFGRSCRSWGWRKSTWLIRRCRTGSSARKTDAWWRAATTATCQRISVGICTGESGVSAGEDCWRNRDDGNAESRTAANTGGIDLDKISPSMSKEDLERVRQEILRVASQSLR